MKNNSRQKIVVADRNPGALKSVLDRAGFDVIAARSEEEIVKKGLTAPRVTPSRLEEVIVSEQFHVFTGTTFTACLLTLENGYTVLGESACASPENFDADLGRKIARDNAKNKIWQLEGYLLYGQVLIVLDTCVTVH